MRSSKIVCERCTTSPWDWMEITWQFSRIEANLIKVTLHLIEIYSLFLGFHELSNTRRLQSFQFSHASHNRGPTTLSSFDVKITISLAGIGCWTMNKTTISAIFFYGHFCCRIIMRRWRNCIKSMDHHTQKTGKENHLIHQIHSLIRLQIVIGSQVWPHIYYLGLAWYKMITTRYPPPYTLP